MIIEELETSQVLRMVRQAIELKAMIQFDVEVENYSDHKPRMLDVYYAIRTCAFSGSVKIHQDNYTRVIAILELLIPRSLRQNIKAVNNHEDTTVSFQYVDDTKPGYCRVKFDFSKEVSNGKG